MFPHEPLCFYFCDSVSDFAPLVHRPFMNSTIDVRDKAAPMPDMVYRFPPREAANKKALPHTAKKIAESSNLVDFIVNPSYSSKLFFGPYPILHPWCTDQL